MLRSIPTPEIRTYGPIGSVNVTGLPEPTVNVSLTRADVVLTSKASVPARLTPGMLTATVPLIRPARPAGSGRGRAVPPVIDRIGVAPPKATATLVAAIRMIDVSSPPPTAPFAPSDNARS